MDTQRKGQALAKLHPDIVSGTWPTTLWNPYDSGTYGLAQFAAILLESPEVHAWQVDGDGFVEGVPTQASLLDDILRMNGIEA